MGNWGLVGVLGPAWKDSLLLLGSRGRGMRRWVLCWPLASGTEEGAPVLLLVAFFGSSLTQVRGSWQKDERPAWCLHKHRADLPAGFVTRIMLSAVTHLELLSGLLVEGREGYECGKKGKHYCLLPWIIQVTRLVLFVLVWISTCLFRKKAFKCY